MKLTKTAIDKMKYEADGNKQDIRWDSALPNFGVRVYPSGRKSFVFSYRAHGRKRIMVLGSYGAITLVQARELAKKTISSVLNGHDPAQERVAQRKSMTVADLCTTYLEDHARLHKKSWKDDERRIKNRIIPALGKLKIKAVTRSDIAALHRKIGKNHPYEANRMLEMMAKMFSLAEDWGFAEELKANPARRIKKFKEEKRDRWVSPEELPRLAKAIDEETNVYARYALWLYLFTGMRKRELLKAKWEHVDFSRKEIRIPDTKSGRVHYLPLSDEAIAVLNRIPREQDNPYMIVGAKAGRHLVNIDKPWRRVRAKAGVEDVRLHDLRRTVGSWLAQSGNSLHLIGRVLGHKSTRSTEVYARFGQDHVRDALDNHGAQIMDAVGATGVSFTRKEIGSARLKDDAIATM